MKTKKNIPGLMKKCKGKSKSQKNKGPKSRKEIRQGLRRNKKLRKAMHQLNKRGAQQNKDSEIKANQSIEKSPQVLSKETILKKQNAKKKRDRINLLPTLSVKAERSRLDQQMRRQRYHQLTMANKEEEKNIRKLEKQLKLNRRKSKSIPKSFTDEGLDYLLEVCDADKLQALGACKDADESSDESDFGEEFSKVPEEEESPLVHCEGSDYESGSNLDDDPEEEMSDVEEMEEDESESSSGDDYTLDEKTDGRVKAVQKRKPQKEVEIRSSSKEKRLKKAGQKNKSDEEESDGSDDDFKEEDSESEMKEDQDDENQDAEYWEDIYGRKRDKQGNVVKENTGSYIPPHLRNKSASNSDDIAMSRLKRQMQGLINRVAESNMSGVASQLETIMMSHSRGSAGQVLGQLLHAAVAPAHSLTPSKLVAEHALLLTILHAHVGSDIGAAFLQTTVEKFHSLYLECEDIENKTLNNLLLLLCFLYSFKVFQHRLIFDIIKLLHLRFHEKDVELILLVLKTIGPSLRKDDPAALKEIITQLQMKAAEATQSKDNARVGFMLDVLLAIKNNNMSRIPDYDPDTVTHLRKVLRSLLRPGLEVTEFNISLDDLLNADKQGRWWVVGSAWQGTGPGLSAEEQNKNADSQNFSQKLLDLARKQRMNTDVRRNIFCILMTAEDYIDAFEKLLHLGLKGQQEREISYVTLNCCLQETTFNPYYFHLAQKFCDFDRKFRMAIQCSIWDKIKELSNLSLLQLQNLSSFTSNLILENGLPLSVLKVIQFADLTKSSIKFVRRVLLDLLLAKNEEVCSAAFSRVSSTEQLALFRESVRLFLHRYVLRNKKVMQGIKDVELLTARVSVAERALGNTRVAL